MTLVVIMGILIPFFGTSLGAASVFFLRDQIKEKWQKALNGFAAGVMTAASVWSLLIPAMEMCGGMGRLRFLPAMAAFLAGVLFFYSSRTAWLHGSLRSPLRSPLRS